MDIKSHKKVLIVIVVLVGAVVWGFDSTRTRSYSGIDLNFGVGSGPVTMTNPSGAALPVQLVSTRADTFTVSSSIEGVSGRSTSQGSGRNRTQLFEFTLPSGVSEFTVVSGTDVNFVASTDTLLEAAVQPLNAENSKNTLGVAVVVMLGSLFYLSSSNGHRWISATRRKQALDQAAAQEAEIQNFNRIFERATSDKS